MLLACGPGGDADPSAGPGSAAGEDAAPALAPTPSTDIWVADLTVDGNGVLSLGEAMNVTQRPGYDNQPFFLEAGQGFWYTTIDELGEADIWLHDLATGSNGPVTSTAPESEYSATPAPMGGFTAIRVEADSTQRLWHFDVDGGNGQVLFPDLAPVGYHAWAAQDTVVMYVLGNPATLRVGILSSGEVTTHAENIGRSMHRIPGTTDVSFVQRVSAEESWISRLDPATGEQERLIEAMEGGDFHAWTPDGVLLMGHQNRLYAWRPGDEGDWEEVGVLDDGLSISRLAVSMLGKVAIVGLVSGG